MSLERPDLSNVSPDIRAYIESLETELARTKERSQSSNRGVDEIPLEPSEPVTTIQVITISKQGFAKRTARHLYTRQRRGGMGVFDLETPESDPPAHLVLADESEDLLLITDFGRGYRIPVSKLASAEVRGRGQSLSALVTLQGNESIRVILPARDEGYLALLSERGYVRLIRHNYVMRPGAPLFDVGRFGPIAAGNWTSGEGELFIATRQGKAIRFKEKMVHANGSLGIRLDRGDDVVSVTGVTEDSGVFLLSGDGKGSIRLMAGFAANKAPGAGGKVALKTNHLIGALTVTDHSDLFVISQLSKIIRFQALEIPPKEGVVQGVNCMSLRADEAVVIAVSEAA